MTSYLDLNVMQAEEMLSLKQLELLASGAQETQKGAVLRTKLYAVKAGLVFATLAAISAIAFIVLFGVQTPVGAAVCVAAVISLAAIIWLGKKYRVFNQDFSSEISKMKQFLELGRQFFVIAYMQRAKAIEQKCIEAKAKTINRNQFDAILNDDTIDLEPLQQPCQVKQVKSLAERINKLKVGNSHLAKEIEELKIACTLFIEGRGQDYSLRFTPGNANLIKMGGYVTAEDRTIYNLRVLAKTSKNRFKTSEQMAAESELATSKKTITLQNIIKKEEEWVLKFLNQCSSDFQQASLHLAHVPLQESWGVENFKEKFDEYLSQGKIDNISFAMWKILAEELVLQEPLNEGSKFDAPFNELLEKAKMFVEACTLPSKKE